MKNTVEPMRNLSPQQKQEAEQLFAKAIKSANSNDYAAAAQYYKKAAEYGHPGAQNNLGNQYLNGNGVDRNPQEAVRLFSESASQGNLYGMRNLASCYMNGAGTAADFDLAVEWLETAADRKDPLACAQLAKAYDNWQHKDGEKTIYWRKKAAEYGNADSMFFLGEYYAKKGDNQNLSEAMRYYESAAINGNAEMKLKVARAFDIPTWGTEPALSLEKAEHWYNEVLICDDGKLKLDAAKGLDVQYTHDGGFGRPALNAQKAYMTYRSLGMSGNKEACALAAYCSEIGNGTTPNIDIAIMLYEKAGYREQAEWCKKKKAGTPGDEAHSKHLSFEMPRIEKSTHAQNSEYYNENVYSVMCEYHGRIYYVSRSYHENHYLCSSDATGENVEIIAEVNDRFISSYVHVNDTGIYLYYLGDYDTVLVQHLSFDGSLISECRDEYEGGIDEGHEISCLCFYENNLYYVYSRDHSGESTCVIKCMHIDKNRIEDLYEKATSVSKLYATADEVIFLARYKNEECEASWVDGWMILDLLTCIPDCLSNPYCSPENVIDDPEIYDRENPRYNDKCDYDRDIVFFDLSRSIFWTRRDAMEGSDSKHLKKVEYWEPHSLWGDRDSVVADMPIWRMNKSWSSGREYFDGTYHYYAESYYVFKSSDKFGNIYEWSTGNGGHGVCDRFVILGEYMYLNIAAYDEEQYPLTVGVGKPIRKSWFKNPLPKSVIDAYSSKDI